MLYNVAMKKIILLFILIITIANSTEYRLTHLKKGGMLNVRELPVVNSRTLVGKLPYNAIAIEIKRCKYNKKGQEWCYVSYPLGGKHIEGWVSRYYLEPMKDYEISKVFYIKNFLNNYYMADEENFLDKLKVFYKFPMQQYMYNKNVTHMALRSKKVNFYKRWTKRRYQIGYMKILKRKAEYIDVQVTVFWKHSNYKEDESGKDIHKLRLVHDGKQFKVLAIKILKHTVYPKIVEEENLTIALGDERIDDKQFYIKAGSFLENPSEEYLLKIGESGFTYMIERVMQGENTIKRVYIGPFPTTVETMEALEKVRRDINKNAYIQTAFP